MRRSSVVPLLVILVVVASSLAVAVGAVSVSPLSLFRLLLNRIGFSSITLPSQQDQVILLYIRLPRVVAALLVGASLAVCGVVMQGLFRNPMASPDILGISTGGSLGAVVAIHTGLFAASIFFLPLLTIIGAVLSAGLIYIISSYRGKTSLLFVVLAGLAISSFFNGLVSAILLFSKQYQVSQFIFWTMGGFDGRMWKHITLPLPLLLPALALLFLFSRDLNLFALGEEHAHSLGMPVERTKRILLVVTAVVTALAISIGGPVGFVGLLIPHFFRFIVGPDHRILMPVSALGGGAFSRCLRSYRSNNCPAFRDPGGHYYCRAGQPLFPLSHPSLSAQRFEKFLGWYGYGH